MDAVASTAATDGTRTEGTRTEGTRTDDTAGCRLAGRMTRAVRSERRISQRELAVLAGVPRATIGRIEADQVSPRIDTMVTVLAGAGFRLGLLDQRGRPIELHAERDVLIDRAGRHLPTHLNPVPTPSYFSPVGEPEWWGWHHIAWYGGRYWVPEHTYWKRRPREVVSLTQSIFHRVWDDAT